MGGQRVCNETARGPNSYAPTVLTQATRDMELSCEETFGLVVPVFRFADEAEVIAQANDTPFGLVGHFFSHRASGKGSLHRLGGLLLGVLRLRVAFHQRPICGNDMVDHDLREIHCFWAVPRRGRRAACIASVRRPSN